MKTSYTKRALAFWLAVAMLATGAPAAFAANPGAGEDTSVSTTTPGTGGETEDLTTPPETPVIQALTIASASVAEKTYDGKTEIDPEKITVSFNGADGEGPKKGTDYTVSGAYASADAGDTVSATITVTLTETGKTKYSLAAPTCQTNGKIAKVDLGEISPAKQSVKVNTLFSEIESTLQKTAVTGVDGETVTGTFQVTDVHSNGALPSAMTLSNADLENFTNTSGNYTLTATFTPTGESGKNYNEKTGITFSCDVTGPDSQMLTFEEDTVTATFGGTAEANTATSTAGSDSGKITYASTKTSVATVDENTGAVTIVGVGTTTITAHTDGSEDYLPADASYTLTVNPKDISQSVTIDAIATQTYDGTEKKPALTVKDGQTQLNAETDYDVEYADNVFPGTATVTVKFKGNYKGTKSTTFTINSASYANTTITQSVVAGQDAVLTIPTALANAEITKYGEITVDGTNKDIVDGAPSRRENAITAKIASGATNEQTANIKITLTTRGYGQVSLTYELTVSDSKTQLTASQIEFESKTVTADGKTYFKLDNASLSGVEDTNGKWTYALQGVSAYSADNQGAMPQFQEPGTYTIVASYEGDKYVGSKTATLTIRPQAVKEGLRVTATKAGSDDNRYDYDLLVRRGTRYIDLNVDADDDLVRQAVDGTRAYWIGFDLSVYLDGAGTSVDDLYVSRSGRSGSWERIGSLTNSECYIGDFYLDRLGSDNDFTLWFDTDGDTDNSDRLYLATSASGANEYYIDVDFDAYRYSSSSGSSSSSSSDTSRKDGDRVSTTTVDRTPSVTNRSASVTFSSSSLSDALDENQREARHEDADRTYIELDARTSRTVDDTTITVPRRSLDSIADADTGLILTTNQGTLTFDDRALARIYSACDKTNIDFYLEEEDDDQYVVLVKDGSDDVIDLGSGEVEIVFDYRLKSGERASDVKVYRVGDGDDTWLASYGGSTIYGGTDTYAAAARYVTDMKADYSSSKREVTFTTDTLGTFLITTDTLTTGPSTTTPTTPVYSRFADVPASRWSASYINKLAALGVINGTGGGYFEPTLSVTREEFVKMLAGVAGANVTGYTASRFPDVPASRWSAPYIAWAADRGITAGTDGGRFAPTMKITREEMAAMIYRYVQISGQTLPAKNAPVAFADAGQISGWAQTAVSVMQQAGIIDGNVTNGRYTFDPKMPASREECAKMLSILYDLI